MMMPIDAGSDVLLVTDIQNDFCRGGALAGADEIVSPVNTVARRFDTVVPVQDWHPFRPSLICQRPFCRAIDRNGSAVKSLRDVASAGADLEQSSDV
jgi:nicotinamidase-related amidase